MAGSHHIAIAKASLSARLLRADPVSVSRDEITNFHSLLDKALTICSSTNIQNCKRWILSNMASPGRMVGLAKYLATLAPVLTDSTTPTGRKSSARQKRLHVLYLINDLLHHLKYLEPDNDVFAEGVKDFLGGMFAVATYPNAIKQLTRLERLLGIWESKHYYPQVLLDQLRTMTRDVASAKEPSGAPDGASHTAAVAAQTKRKALLLPPFHGDPSIPFYDLPAGNLLPLIVPNSTAPINPRLVKPVQFPSITPDGKLVSAVQDFLTSVDSMFGGKGSSEEPDAVGGFGGIDGEGYYGWSKAFCEQMRQKKKAAAEKDRGRSSSGGGKRGEKGGARRGSYSSDYSSRSRSSSRSKHDRRRRSRSVSSNSRSRSRRARRDYGRTRSQSPSRSTSPQYRGFAGANQDSTPPTTTLSLPGSQWTPPPPSPLQQQQISYGFQSQQFPQATQGWVPPPPPLSNSGFPVPPPLPPPPQFQQGFQQYFSQMGGMQGMQMQGMQGMHNIQAMQMAYGQWQQPPHQQHQHQRQQQQGYGQQQQQQQQQNGGYGMQMQSQGPLPPTPTPPNNNRSGGFEDYRSIEGWQVGGKRGWKT